MGNKISIISGYKNEEKNLKIFIDKIDASMKKYKIKYELILIDDYSADNSVKIIKQKIKKNKNIKLLLMKKNYGRWNTYQTGIDYVNKNNFITFIDCDLQDPPEVLAKELSKGFKKNTTIHFVRKERDDPLFQKFYTSIAYFFLKIISFGKIVTNSNMFKIIPPFVLKKLKKNKETHPYFPHLISKYSKHETKIMYVRKKRKYGKSNYNLFTLPPWLTFYGALYYFTFNSLIFFNLSLFISYYLMFLTSSDSYLFFFFNTIQIINIILIITNFIYKKINSRIFCKYFLVS